MHGKGLAQLICRHVRTLFLSWSWTGSSWVFTYLANIRCVHGVGMSYRKAKWLPEADVMEAKPQLLRNFMQRRNAGVALQDLNVSFKDGCDRHGKACRQYSEHQPDEKARLQQ